MGSEPVSELKPETPAILFDGIQRTEVRRNRVAVSFVQEVIDAHRGFEATDNFVREEGEIQRHEARHRVGEGPPTTCRLGVKTRQEVVRPDRYGKPQLAQ